MNCPELAGTWELGLDHFCKIGPSGNLPGHSSNLWDIPSPIAYTPATFTPAYLEKNSPSSPPPPGLWKSFDYHLEVSSTTQPSTVPVYQTLKHKGPTYVGSWWGVGTNTWLVTSCPQHGVRPLGLHLWQGGPRGEQGSQWDKSKAYSLASGKNVLPTIPRTTRFYLAGRKQIMKMARFLTVIKI